MKNRILLLIILIAISILILMGVSYFFLGQKSIFPEGLILNKTTPIKLPFKIIVEPNHQETVAVFRELDGKEIKIESFFDIGLGCAYPDVAGGGPPTTVNIYPTNDRLYTEGGYQPRPLELNACAKGKIIQFKVQIPYNPEKDIYYLVIQQKGKVKLKIKLPPISGNLEEITKKTLIRIYNPLESKIDEIFDYHPAFSDFQAEIFKIINYADIFYTINPQFPVNNIEDVKKSEYQQSAKNLLENTKKKTVVIELDLDKAQKLILDHFSPPLEIEIQKIILQKDLIVGDNLLGYSICAITKDNLIYCLSNSLGLTGNREEINKIIKMIGLL